jgi:hypothetical protein
MESLFLAQRFSSQTTVNPIALLIYFAFIIFMLACYWRIFEKAGVAGILGIIPIVNIYYLFKIAKVPCLMGLLLFVPFVNFFVIFYVWFELAQRFGKGFLFTLGMIFLPFIFFPILAFGDAEYQDKFKNDFDDYSGKSKRSF